MKTTTITFAPHFTSADVAQTGDVWNGPGIPAKEAVFLALTAGGSNTRVHMTASDARMLAAVLIEVANQVERIQAAGKAGA